MTRLLPVILLFIGLTACRSGQQAVRQELHTEQVRADTLAALLAEDLQIKLHNVVIAMPPDSPRVQLTVREIDLTRARSAAIEATAAEQTAAEQTATQAVTTQTPASPSRSPTLRLFLIPMLLLLLIPILRIWRTLHSEKR